MADWPKKEISAENRRGNNIEVTNASIVTEPKEPG